jgi:hypothetical protein
MTIKTLQQARSELQNYIDVLNRLVNTPPDPNRRSIIELDFNFFDGPVHVLIEKLQEIQQVYGDTTSITTYVGYTEKLNIDLSHRLGDCVEKYQEVLDAHNNKIDSYNKAVASAEKEVEKLEQKQATVPKEVKNWIKQHPEQALEILKLEIN